MKKILVAILSALFVLQAGTVTASAAERQEVGSDARRLIFPITGYMAYFKAIDGTGKEIDASGYVSGVYDNSVPRKLLYEIDYDFFNFMNERRYLFSSTGTHHLKINYQSSNDFKIVLQFYELGVVHAQWGIADLIDDKKVTFNSSGYWFEASNYDHVNDILYIETRENQHFLFDIYTGEIIYQSYENPYGEIDVGSTVIVTGDYYNNGYNDCGSMIYGDRIPVWVKCIPHVVSQIDGRRVLLGADGGINSWVHIREIIEYIDLRN